MHMHKTKWCLAEQVCTDWIETGEKKSMLSVCNTSMDQFTAYA